MSTVPVVEIDTDDVTAYIRDKTIVLRLNQLDFTLVDPASLPEVGHDVTVDEPAWTGVLVSRSITEYEGTVFVAVTAKNEDVALPDDAPFGISDAPSPTATYGYERSSFQFRQALVENATETRASCTVFEPGLIPGMLVRVTNANIGLNSEEFTITEVSVTWHRDDFSVHEVTFGTDRPVRLEEEQERPRTPFKELPSVILPDDLNLLYGTVSDGGGNRTYTNPTNANDGTDATYTTRNSFAGDGVTNYVSLLETDLAGAYLVGRMTVFGGGGSSSSNFTGYPWLVDYSADGSSWTNAPATYLDAAVGTTMETTTITITTPVRYRYWRLRHEVVTGGFEAAIWIKTWAIFEAESRRPPPGQRVTEFPSGTTASTTITTNFPYHENGLRVSVDGVDVTPDQTDPEAGEFTLPIATTGRRVQVTYQVSNSTPTGATNTYTWPTGVAYPTHAILGSGGDGSGDHVLLDDNTWVDLPGGGGGIAGSVFTIVAGWDGGDTALDTADMADIDVVVPADGEIVAAYVTSDPSGSAVVDVWVDDAASHPPTDADSITASAPPTISSDTLSVDSTLTGWTVAFTAADVFRFHPDSVSTAKRITVTLLYERT